VSLIRSAIDFVSLRPWRWVSLSVVAALSITYLAAILYLVWAYPTITFSPGDETKPIVKMPDDFLFGTATSAHQIEGGNDKNDWAAFEREAGRIKHGDVSGQACDSWNRIDDDIALMQELGANSYRFSIEWSRLEPTDGVWDDAAWNHYAGQLKKLKAHGIAPMVTLLHFTLPHWLAQRGGATAADFPEKFGRFARVAAERLGPDVALWCTINEPNIMMYFGYVTGIFPPGKKSNADAVHAFAGLVRAHAAATVALKQVAPKAKVGAAIHLVDFEPKQRWNLADWGAAHAAASAFNWAFCDSIQSGHIRFNAPGFPSINEPLPACAPVDFIGVNYYRRDLVHFALTTPGLIETGPGPGEQNDLGWEIHPEGLLVLLREVHHRYHVPIYITENGLADAHDTKRAPFLRQHLHALQRAVNEGIPVKGYYHWSLLDNFEWAEGFEPRFGLYKMNYKTLSRTPTAGAEMFKKIARELGTK